MTVCTACIFTWFHSESELGGAIVAASDRMLTDEGLGIEYQSNRQKSAFIGKNCIALVAGDMTVHSEALAETLSELWEEGRSILEKAHIYGEAVARVRRRRAEQRYLQPLNLTFDTFLASQGNMAPKLVDEVAYQLHNYSLDVEAIVTGCDGKIAHLFRVDSFGTVTNHDDIGFLSIGAGGIHSSAYFMQEPHATHVAFPNALMSTFLAKRRAEVAPGVGELTDMYVITADGAEPINRDIIDSLSKAELELREATTEKIAELRQRLMTAPGKDNG